MFRYSVLVIALTVSFSGLAAADSDEEYMTDDAMVYQTFPDDNYGDDYLAVVGENTGKKYVTFFKFDVSGYSGVTLDFANFYVYVESVWGDIDADETWVARCTSDWDEDTIIWNNRPGYTDWYQWSFNEGWWVIAMRTWAQGWIDGTYSNYGFQIGANIPGAGNGYFHPRTREYAGSSYDPYVHIGWPAPVESSSIGEIKAAFK